MTSAPNAIAKGFVLNTLHCSPALPGDGNAAAMRPEDWDGLLDIARTHRLGPILHDRLRRKGLSPRVPSQVRERLQASHRKHTLMNLALYRELMAITQLLNDVRIPSIALKGAFLARFAYPEMGLRPMRDLDLLVPREHALHAFDLLIAHGYAPEHDGLPEAHLHGGKLHLPTLLSPNHILVELHHRLTFPDSRSADADAFDNGLWGRYITKPIGTLEIRFLCPEDLLLHLCYHATAGHQFSVGPLALMDVALLAESEKIDWPAFLRAASGVGRRCALAPLYLSKRHLGANIPDDVLSALQGGETTLDWLASAEYLLFSDLKAHTLLNSTVQKMIYSGSFREKISHFSRIVFPPRSTIATHFPVRQDSMAAFLYYPKNWYRLLRDKAPGLARKLVSRPDDLGRLAAHKSDFTTWLDAGVPSGARPGD